MPSQKGGESGWEMLREGEHLTSLRTYLAAEAAVGVFVLKGTCTCFTCILVLCRARLRSLVEKHNTATVHNVCLHEEGIEKRVRKRNSFATANIHPSANCLRIVSPARRCNQEAYWYLELAGHRDRRSGVSVQKRMSGITIFLITIHGCKTVA